MCVYVCVPYAYVYVTVSVWYTGLQADKQWCFGATHGHHNEPATRWQ